MTFVYCTHGSKCVKCNSFHKVKHHREIVWCYKANFKTNPLDLKKRKENCALICLSTSIVKKSIKLTAIYVHFGNISSKRNGMIIKISTLSSFKNFLCLLSEKEKIIVGALNYLSWIMFSRQSVNNNKHPRIITYINVQLV